AGRRRLHSRRGPSARAAARRARRKAAFAPAAGIGGAAGGPGLFAGGRAGRGANRASGPPAGAARDLVSIVSPKLAGCRGGNALRALLRGRLPGGATRGVCALGVVLADRRRRAPRLGRERRCTPPLPGGAG